MASDIMTVAALGRPFGLGMLYNAHKDELIPGFTLWHEKSIHGNTLETPQPSSEFQITASDSTEEKCSLLSVDASLKASFLGGLIQLGGSASYLNDRKQNTNQARVTLQYKATTNNKSLLVTDLGHIDISLTEEKGLATHVVAGIVYGANAFFVFDCEKSDSSQETDIHGSMHAVIKKIPFVSVEGQAKVKLTDEEKKLSKTFSCKFLGDFFLKSNPATFDQAVNTYVELPKLLGEKGENAVPMMVSLLPLMNFEPSHAPLVKQISIELVLKAQSALEDVHYQVMRCNNLLGDSVVTCFPQLHEKVSHFKTFCVDYMSEVQQIMAKKLPSIRAGSDTESNLVKIFDHRDKTPFSQEKLSKWLDNKEREVNVMRPCVDMMKGIKIVPNKSELDREVLAADVEHALCFVFTSLESADPFLDELAHQLKIRDTADAPLRTPGTPWYFSDDVVTKMREKAKHLHDLSTAPKKGKIDRFLVTALANKKYKGASIYHYKSGILVNDNYSDI